MIKADIVSVLDQEIRPLSLKPLVLVTEIKSLVILHIVYQILFQLARKAINRTMGPYDITDNIPHFHTFGFPAM